MLRVLLLASLVLTLPLVAEEVTLETAGGSLFGTLEVPAGNAPFPLVILHAGSGPTDRNGNTVGVPGTNDSHKLLAAALRERGIATLRYDKRGIAASAAAGPREEDLRFTTYVDDLVAWINRMDADARFSTITVAGHSEGGLIATLAAQQAPVDRVVSIAGAGRPAGDVILAQLEVSLTPSLLASSRQIVAELNAGRTVASTPPALAALFRLSVQPYLISWFRYDPVVETRELTQPLLVLQGTTDIQVPVSDAQLLAAASTRATLVVIDGMNHVLKNATLDNASQNQAYNDPSLPLNEKLVAAIANFVQPLPRRRALH